MAAMPAAPASMQDGAFSYVMPPSAKTGMWTAFEAWRSCASPVVEPV